MNQPITIYLIGYAGTGKYTIAKEFSALGYKIIDNHLINNPIFSLLSLDEASIVPEKAWNAIEKIRDIVLSFASEDTKLNHVFTNELLDDEYDYKLYEQVLKVAEKRGAIFIPVILKLDIEEHKKRIENLERKERFKSTKLPIENMKKGLIKINHPNLIEIDITKLSPEEVKNRILKWY